MNRIFFGFVIVLTFGMTFCEKERTASLHFNPTDQVISTLGPKMRLVVRVPGQNFYNFSSQSLAVVCNGTLCKNFIVPVSEMNNVAQNLSDTTIFHWKFMTAESPFPDSQCVLLIYGGHNDSTYEDYDFMCSIGDRNPAIGILKELSKSFSGEAHSIFDEIIKLL